MKNPQCTQDCIFSNTINNAKLAVTEIKYDGINAKVSVTHLKFEH